MQFIRTNIARNQSFAISAINFSDINFSDVINALIEKNFNITDCGSSVYNIAHKNLIYN